MRQVLGAAIALSLACNSFSQVIDSVRPTSPDKEIIKNNYRFNKDYRYKHYLSAQLNQFFNTSKDYSFGANAARNPFFISYSINDNKTGNGLGIAYGYNSNRDVTTDAADNKVETGESNIRFRFSIEKKKDFVKRFTVDYGIDAVFTFDKTISLRYVGGLIDESNIRKNGYGIGPRFSMLFKILENVLVGTESSLYFRVERTRKISQFTGLPVKRTSSSGFISNIVLPTAVIISVRFH